MFKRALLVVMMTAGLVVAVELPALAWVQHTTSGRPGYVHSGDPRGAEGGICGGPGVPLTCSPDTNQIFIGRYYAHAAPYPVPQRISSTAYLYYLTTAGTWQFIVSNFEGACAHVAPNGACGPFGDPAPDFYGQGACPCTPAFYKITSGYNYTVTVHVTWSNATTGATLASALYHPAPIPKDIGCAAFAEGPPYYRCRGPLGLGGVGYLAFPHGGSPGAGVAPTATATSYVQPPSSNTPSSM